MDILYRLHSVHVHAVANPVPLGYIQIERSHVLVQQPSLCLHALHPGHFLEVFPVSVLQHHLIHPLLQFCFLLADIHGYVSCCPLVTQVAELLTS